MTVMRTGVATFTLDYGRCPAWLFQRMTRLGRIIAEAIVAEFGPEEFLRRLSNPVWFQSLGCVMAFDWNASGLTITTMAALKEAFRGREREFGIFICGGKGKTSRKTPDEIFRWQERLGLYESEGAKLLFLSRAAAKVDTSLVQDGFQIYHHNFIFTRKGDWAVIQQGMNAAIQRARRYHWHGRIADSRGLDVNLRGQTNTSTKLEETIINEPHTGIASQGFLPRVLNLTAKESEKNRNLDLELVSHPQSFLAEIKILTRTNGDNTRTHTERKHQFTILDLPKEEFHSHPSLGQERFDVNRLSKTIHKVSGLEPKTFAELLMTQGVGPKTIRALSLVAEVIYGAEPSYRDPARYTFAHGGKDATPFPVDRETYDKTIEVMQRALRLARLPQKEKAGALYRLEKVF